MRIDLKNDELEYANAGHDPAWLIFPNGQNVELLATGTLLGILEGANYPAKRFSLRSGCRLVISTDGITEASDGQGVMYGRKRLLDLLLAMLNSDAQSTFDALHRDVAKVCGSGKKADDVTLLIMDYKTENQSDNEHSRAARLAEELSPASLIQDQ